MTAPANALRTRAELADIEARLYERLQGAEWHPFRPLKVFRLDSEWIMAFHNAASPAIAFGIHPTQHDAFEDAELIAQAIRDKYPCSRA